MSMEVWRGDYDELHEFIAQSWRFSYKNEAIWDFSKEFLQWFMQNPQRPSHYLLGEYREGRLVAFLAGLSRTYRYHDRIIPGVFSTFFSIHPDYVRQRLGFSLIRDAVLLLKEDYQRTGGPALITFYGDAGHPTTQLFEKVSLDTGVPLLKIAQVNLRLKVLDLETLMKVDNVSWYERPLLAWKSGIPSASDQGGGVARIYQEQDLDQCFNLIGEAIRNEELIPNFQQKDALHHQLSYKDTARTMVFEKNGEVKGCINGHFINIIGKNHAMKSSVIDWISDRDLSKQEASQLVRHYLVEMKSAGCSVIFFPDLAYLTKSHLMQGGFLPYHRNCFLYAYNFDSQNLKISATKRAYEILA